jgi:O-acetyl-ADP-ribose deacetylase (regulator of RNase III)
MKLTNYKGDITKLKVDAIVNSANQRMLGGGGVDGAIHRAAGLELLEECKKVGPCLPGDAKITKGYDLPAKYIIHTVGPIYGNEKGREAEILAACYTSSLMLAKEYKIKTIAFPNISTGVYGYPIDEASKIAVETVKEFLEEETGHGVEEVIFVSFDDVGYQRYEDLLENK